MGSVVPVVGTVVGALVGLGVGILIYRVKPQRPLKRLRRIEKAFWLPSMLI